MVKQTKINKTAQNSHTVLVFAVILSFIIVVMVLTRLYLVEKDTVTLKKQVSTLLEKTELQQVGAPVQEVFGSPYEQMGTR